MPLKDAILNGLQNYTLKKKDKTALSCAEDMNTGAHCKKSFYHQKIMLFPDP